MAGPKPLTAELGSRHRQESCVIDVDCALPPLPWSQLGRDLETCLQECVLGVGGGVDCSALR